MKTYSITLSEEDYNLLRDFVLYRTDEDEKEDEAVRAIVNCFIEIEGE